MKKEKTIIIRIGCRPIFYNGTLIHNDFVVEAHVKETGKNYSLYSDLKMKKLLKENGFQWVHGLHCPGAFYSNSDANAYTLSEILKVKIEQLPCVGKW